MRILGQILDDYPSLKLQYEQINAMQFLNLLMPKEQRKELDRIKSSMEDLVMTMEEYNNKDRIEFITNSDGTISLLIKNIGSIESR